MPAWRFNAGLLFKADPDIPALLKGMVMMGGVYKRESPEWHGSLLPQAVAWYRGLLKALLRTGAAAFKTDYGEEIDEQASYAGMDERRLRNLYALLYQKLVWETTAAVRGPGETLIWARSA